jgi:ATP-binding protein involved in chromosome partitioning
VTPSVIPHLIRRLDDGAAIQIQWDEEGHVGNYGARDLRLACQCAECREEISGRPILDPATVPEDIRAGELRLVGAYAVQITWSDGHATGIYPWSFLLERCPCPRCAARSA